MTENEDGYCDDCGAELSETVWLSLDGRERCESCAISSFAPQVQARRPEARDDGR